MDNEFFNVNEIIFSFICEPTSPNSNITSTGYGYDAFVCTPYQSVDTMIKSLSMWNGYTKLYIKDGHIYKYYEIGCQLKDFFKSDIFARLCNPYNTKITICENSEEIYNVFFKDAKLSH